MVRWMMRATMEEIDVARRYAGHPTVFSIRLHHGGEFTTFPGRMYINGKETYVDLLDMDTFSVHDIDDMMDELGYIGEDVVRLYYHFKSPVRDLDFGLFALASELDVRNLASFVGQHKIIDVYTEHGITKLHTYRMSPNPTNVRITEIVQNPTCSKRLFLNWHESPSDFDKDKAEVEVDLGQEPSTGDDLEDDLDKDNRDDLDKDNRDDLEDDNDSDFVYDGDDVIDNVNVDMQDFFSNIDRDAEWVGSSSKPTTEVREEEEGENEVINTEVMLSGSSSDEGKEGKRRKTIRAIQRAHENDAAMVSEPFYIFQTFSSTEAFKERVRLYAIETRRELEFEKNDKNRVRVVCNGSLPDLDNENVQEKCPWVLYCSKWKRDVDWMVKTYTKEHRCLQTRKVRSCDYKYLAKQIVPQIERNPEIPIRALRDQLQRQYKVDISKMKTFRARHEALKHVRGDYASQYNLLRDYALEVQARNPETTIKIDVESESNPGSETRTFRRIYVCIGALKKGFAAGKRDFLGLDGAFIKGPFPGQILSAVALDGNNGIYPIAYAVVESERKESWTWFLSNLGDDLGLGTNSNFTFMTDRQKGVLPAIATLFPCAENRYCLRHIHENMKKSWKGKEFKEKLWNCATACTVQEFNKAIEELKKLNQDTYEWLKLIPPQHWARSHFTGRAHCDALLNNICEAFNSKLNEGRDTPILTCLEYVREYLMKKIVIVEKEIKKATGPLTPTATKTLDKIKSEASEYQAIFCGDGKYQVVGPWQDQCVVDVGQQTCTCKKWQLIGIPCKHGVAAIWDMRSNRVQVGIPETFVHPCYWLTTWRNVFLQNWSNQWEVYVGEVTMSNYFAASQLSCPNRKTKEEENEIGFGKGGLS